MNRSQTNVRRLADYKSYEVYKESETVDSDHMNYYWLCYTGGNMIDIYLSLDELKEAVDRR